MIVRPYAPDDKEAVIPLIAGFRVDLAALKNVTRAPDMDAAREELEDYLRDAYPVVVAQDESGALAGYMVCKIDVDVIWVESLYVAPAFRRRGVAGQLYDSAEQLSAKSGGDTLYNWVHPNNDAIIGFLRKRGYTVLNLVELRRPRKGEITAQQITVGDHIFDY